MKSKNKTKISRIGWVFVLLTVVAGLSVFFPTQAHAQAEKNLDDKAIELCRSFNEMVSKEYNLLDCGQPGDIADFTQFAGGLTPPSGEGLSRTLTEHRDLREFILTITKFVLSFLGIAAVLIVIYGGFQYVTARGEEEQVTKGKKSIMYALVGIIIIIGSFAIVNTLFKAGGGDSRGSAGEQEGTNIQQGTFYRHAALEISNTLTKFLQSYGIFASNARDIASLQNLQAPENGDEAKQFLSAVDEVLGRISSRSNSTSPVFTAAQKFSDDFVSQWKEFSESELQERLTWNDRTSHRLLASFPPSSSLSNRCYKRAGRFCQAFTSLLDTSGLEGGNKLQFAQTVDELKERMVRIKNNLGAIADAPASSRINRQNLTDEEFQRIIAGIDPNQTIKGAFEETLVSLDSAKLKLIERPQEPLPVLEVTRNLNKLSLVVRDIQFVSVVITASATEGNAPLSVQLDGLQSRDPSNQTIVDSRYEWDLDGNGRFGDQTKLCEEPLPGQGRATVTCTYTKPGTYVISLHIKSADPQIAEGQAFLGITVKQPSSRIHLKAEAGEGTEILQEYDRDGNLTVSKTSYRITLSQAKAGIRFDASSSTDGTGAPNSLVNYEWRFGDGTDPIRGPTKSIIDNPKKTYAKQGVSPLTLEVTDKGGVQDRFIINIIVSDFAAKITTKKQRGDLNTVFEFDGSSSRSDAGNIETFRWEVIDERGQPVSGIENNKGDTLRFKFGKPGKYTVRLTVGDKTGNESSDELEVLVESQAPEAHFDVLKTDSSQPNFFTFDASRSFDPDQGDTLQYQWRFFEEKTGRELTEGIDYERKEGKLTGQKNEASKILLRMLRTGTFKVRLMVEDIHGEDELRKSDTEEKSFTVSSIVELAWDPPNQAVTSTLKNGKATIRLTAKVKNGRNFQIMWGDEKQDEGPVMQSFLTLEHTYDRAATFSVVLKVTSENNGENTIKQKVYVNSGDSPLAVITLSTSGAPLAPEDDLLEIDRKTILQFDAGNSINTDGGSENLEFSWDFGDGAKSTSKKTNHTYGEVSPSDPGFYEIKLTVTDSADRTKSNATSVKVKVVGKKPTVQVLNVVKKTQGEITPVEVEVTASGAVDPDGRIIEYRFWYFDPADPDRKLGIQNMERNRALLTIETQGTEGEERKYLFCVDVTDNENNTVECRDLFEESDLPFMVVVNGPNKAPIADFKVDRTSVRVGEGITFSSSSKDPDGHIKEYVWDLEGDGFQNNSPTGLATITHVYKKKSPKTGYRVKLKVTDDKGASGFSKEIPIIVESGGNPPRADFLYELLSGAKVTFKDASTVDPTSNAAITKWKWDFDLAREFHCDTDPKSCNKDPSDDVDSVAQNPTFEYPTSGLFTVRLSIEDAEGNTADRVKGIEVRRGGDRLGGNGLEAILRTDPERGRDGSIHLSGNGGFVTFFASDSKGPIVSYELDQNVFFDTSGDGKRDNDRDCGSPTSRPRNQNTPVKWRCNYQKAWLANQTNAPQYFRAQLTVIDSEGNRDMDSVDVIFDSPRGAASIAENLKKLGVRNTVLLGLIASALLLVIGYIVRTLFKQGKPRIEK